ncbi:MAG: hypothetical protein UT39_C0008G0003 [Candidatus Woesebacteria bacterium GW2011_GWA1_39_21]|uniref:CBS domain-containing protein n=1 Tax=Candidatus Woesebacteria bacterium GW2011_GWA1_39_21 TaxID=1618550 RepID=A0A0G0QLU2_9BACT|nr:MAG: hypothetical protein UT39_C0008G0003 [Candidatus Woesebacteria bacterium GW2011_GWA1_39_21]
MLVREIMSKKVTCISPECTTSQILKIFRKYKISGAPVVGKSGKLLGIVSEKDVLFKLFLSEEEFYNNVDYYFSKTNREEDLDVIRNLKAKNIMSRDVVSIGPDEHVLTACSKLLMHHVRRLPVVENKKLVGMVTTNDVFLNYLQYILGEKG